MEKIQENKRIDAAPRVGVVGKMLAVAAGAAAGAGALVATVNHAISQNIKQWMAPGIDQVGDIAAKMANNKAIIHEESEIEQLRNEVANRMRNKILANIKDGEARRIMGDRDGVLTQSFAKARQSKISSVISNHHVQRDISEMCPYDTAIRENIARQLVADEKVLLGLAAEGASAHVPLLDKIKLSGALHLSGGQKTVAALAFTGAAVVTAGAIYYLLNQHAKNHQLQENQISQLGFNV